MAVLDELAAPIVVAPMAGGPSAPELVRAVDEAGGFGFLAFGALSTEGATRAMAEVGEKVRYGVNLFAPQEPLADLPTVEAVARDLAEEHERRGLPSADLRPRGLQGPQRRRTLL